MLRAVVMQQSVSHVIFCPSLASSWAHCMQFSASPLNRLKTPFHCCVCVCQSLSCIQLCATLGTVVCQASLSLEFSSQEYWSGQPFPSPWDLPNPGDEPGSPALQANSLPTELQGKPRKTSTSALFITPKPLTVQITTNCEKFFKRWEYQTTLPAS